MVDFNGGITAIPPLNNEEEIVSKVWKVRLTPNLSQCSNDFSRRTTKNKGCSDV